MASQDARDASKIPWKSARMVSNLNTSGTLWEYRLPPHLSGVWTRVASEKQLEYIIILDPESIYVLLQARHKDHAESTVKCQANLDSETAAALHNDSLYIDDESGGYRQTLDMWFKQYAPMNPYQKLLKLQPDIDLADVATKLWEGARLIIKRLHTDKCVRFGAYLGWQATTVDPELTNHQALVSAPVGVSQYSIRKYAAMFGTVNDVGPLGGPTPS